MKRVSESLVLFFVFLSRHLSENVVTSFWPSPSCRPLLVSTDYIGGFATLRVRRPFQHTRSYCFQHWDGRYLKGQGTRIRERELNTNFSQTFRHPRDIPAKLPGYQAKKFGFPGFTWKSSTPPEDIRTKKFGFGFFFFPEE